MDGRNAKDTFYRFEPYIVRAVVPPKTAGVYQLARYDGSRLIVGYVGRSDVCLQQRLATHNLLCSFDYFWFRSERNAYQAFLSEALLWHELKGEAALLNSLHPAVPEGWELPCPYCAALTQVRQFLRYTTPA